MAAKKEDIVDLLPHELRMLRKLLSIGKANYKSIMADQIGPGTNRAQAHVALKTLEKKLSD